MDEPEVAVGEAGSSTTGVVSTDGGATWEGGGGETLGCSAVTTLGRYTFLTGGGSVFFSSTFVETTVSFAIESMVLLSGTETAEVKLESDAANSWEGDPITKLNSFPACLNPICTDESVRCNSKKRIRNKSNAADVPAPFLFWDCVKIPGIFSFSFY